MLIKSIRYCFLLLGFLSLSASLFAQKSLYYQLRGDTEGDTDVLKPRIDQVVVRLQRQQKNDPKFIQLVFETLHRKFLKQYRPYVDFHELQNGTYDCLTATSLFAVVLADLNISYQIIETNYHVFLLAQWKSSKVLIETTDRLNGLVFDKTELEKRIRGYRDNQLATQPVGDKQQYAFGFKLFQPILPAELPGLLHFNKAVNFYNAGNWRASMHHIALMRQSYASPRTAALSALLAETVSMSCLPEAEKETIVRQLFQGATASAAPVAVR
jgi:hypothetical protein